MSISPPSDIVLDVARAADPTRYAQAAARLSRVADGPTEQFPEILADLPPPAATPAGPPRIKPGDAYQEFEAMVLATMIEATIPDQLTSVFGSGTAGDVWKSMLAEQLGAEMAKAGGVGLARQLREAATPALRSDTEALLVTTLERQMISAMKPEATIPADVAPRGPTE
jgi:hypothetical protein